jgi:cellobiose phosphorylase
MRAKASRPTTDSGECGHFDDADRSYVITNPVTPRPWINYLGNRRLTAFISQNAGGLLWYYEPRSRRLTRYHYTAAPGDRPGFYVYVRDRKTGTVWNPHFAPACTLLDRFECRHAPGVTQFIGEKDGVCVEVTYAIPPGDDVMLWKVAVRNTGSRRVDLELVTYMEFGLLEFMREAIGWCYLKNHFSLRYDPAIRAIRYDYHVFEAPFAPRMVFGCTETPTGWECSRDAFVGPTGSLERPRALAAQATLSNSDLPLGGHACSVLGVDADLAAGKDKSFAYVFALADTWDAADALLVKYARLSEVEKGIEDVRRFWNERLETFQVKTGDAPVDHTVNTWTPYNSAIALELARTISTDHMGTDGLRYRDTTQDAIGVANFDPAFAAERMRMVFAQQTREGGGCFAFYPHTSLPPSDVPRRSDNTVWQVYTVKNLIAETGNMAFLDEKIPFREGGSASVYDHILLGLKYIYERRGPRGLPTLFHADWNDGLALFGDEKAESVMLGMQLVHSCREFREFARRCGRNDDVGWCDAVAKELTTILNSDLVWDGGWYRRLLFSNGKALGSAASRQGRIYLNAQSWAVISGVGEQEGRGRKAMQAAFELLDSKYGIQLHTPPFKGVPEPEDPPLGSNPGIGENGGIFSHANTWAIIAEALQGNSERAFQYYRQIIPEVVSAAAGAVHYGREPYVYVSSIVGPVNDRFGEGGISWLTGTANWMYIAVTQYLLGIRPTLDGLVIQPCLPASFKTVHIRRRFRGCVYEIEVDCAGRRSQRLIVEGQPIEGVLLPVCSSGVCQVRCEC